jgi:hypothetical protein
MILYFIFVVPCHAKGHAKVVAGRFTCAERKKRLKNLLAIKWVGVAE